MDTIKASGLKSFMLALALAAAALLGGASTVRADTNCTGTLGGAATLTTLKGNVTVPKNASCTLAFVNVTGNVEVQRGGSLLITAYREPSTIGGDVDAENCVSTRLEGNVTVGGDLQIHQCTGTAANGFVGPGIVIGGNFECHNNAGPCEAWLGKVDGDVHIHNNGSNTASDVSLNTIGGNLECKHNTAAVTHVHGPNWVTGNAQDQCAGGNAGFVAAGTSIVAPGTPSSSGLPCAGVSSLASLLMPSVPASFPVPNTVITSVTDTPKTATLPERCIVNGYVNDHISPVDMCEYHDGFQVQLPIPTPGFPSWNGRFLFQGGGGTEGSVPTATGSAGTLTPAIATEGYAVASQDGGHENSLLAAGICGSHTNFNAITGTATGGNVNEFYLDPMGVIDNSYQSIDVTTLAAKYVIAAFYGTTTTVAGTGTGPNYSYWDGCSTGGRQGMVMSQNFPQYFDGIVAGDPVYNLEAISLSEVYGVEQIFALYPSGASYNLTPEPYPYPLPPSPPPPPPFTAPYTVAENFPQAFGPIIYSGFPTNDTTGQYVSAQNLFENALLSTCDALDGVADGVIDNLPACQAIFNPSTAKYLCTSDMACSDPGSYNPLQCYVGDPYPCLTAAQIEAAEAINQGPRLGGLNGTPIIAPAAEVAKDHVDPTAQGYAYDGGFMTTVGVPARKIGGPTSVPGDFALGAGTIGYAWIYPPDPSYPSLTLDFTSTSTQVQAAPTGLLNPSSPESTYSTSLDISNFINYGHKIIWYHGLSDPGPPVLGTILYYNEMADRNGGLEKAQAFSRLYPVPNMDHCSGGATTDQFDFLTPLTQWVENGTQPGPIVASSLTNAFRATTYQVPFVSGSPDNAPTTRSRPLCPYPEEAHFTGGTTMVSGVPVATTPSQLAVASNYQCTTYSSTPYFSTPRVSDDDHGKGNNSDDDHGKGDDKD